MCPSICSKLLKYKNVFILFVLFSLALTTTAFVIEYYFHAKPCELCWYQRYYHWALGVIALLGLCLPKIFKPRFTLMLLALVSLIGLGTAIYHTLVQQGIFQSGCGAKEIMNASLEDFKAALMNGLEPEPLCSDKGFTIFGLSLANWNIPTMLVSLMYALAAFWFRNDHLQDK